MAASARTDAAPEEFVIERTFDAPRALMWKLWTDPAHLARWWGPKGFTVGHCKVDLRPGGIFHYGLRAPDGQEIWGKFVYREIVAPERMVYVVSFSDADGGITVHPLNPSWPRQILSTTAFVEKDGKTTVTVRWSPFEATRKEVDTFEAGRESMRQGFTGTFDQLEAYLESL